MFLDNSRENASRLIACAGLRVRHSRCSTIATYVAERDAHCADGARGMCACFAVGVAASQRRAAVTPPHPHAQPRHRRHRPDPAPLGVDGQLTSWLQVRGEFRERIEGFTRRRVHAGQRRRLLAGPVPAQRDGRARARSLSSSCRCRTRARSTRRPARTARAVPRPLDLRMAYGDFGDDAQHGARRPPGAGVRRAAPGRPSRAGSTPRARSTAARVTLKRKRVQVDVFGASVVRIHRRTSSTRAATATASPAPTGRRTDADPEGRPSSRTSSGGSRREPARRTRRRRRHCIRRRSACAWPASCRRGFDYGVEMAVQTGSLGADRRERVGRPLAAAARRSPARGAVRDCSANSTTRPATPIRPTARAAPSISSIPPATTSYGLADQVGWRNIHHAARRPRAHADAKVRRSPAAITRGGSRARPTRSTAPSGALRRARRRRRRRHATSARSSTSRSPYAYSPQLQLAGGYAHIFTGRVPEAGDAGRVLQLPVRHGHLRLPRRRSRRSTRETHDDVTTHVSQGRRRLDRRRR